MIKNLKQVTASVSAAITSAIGTVSDAATTTVGTTASLVSYVKGILNQLAHGTYGLSALHVEVAKDATVAKTTELISGAAVDFGAAAKTSIQTAGAAALTADNLDHLLLLDGTTNKYPEQAVADSVIAKIIAKGDPATPSTYDCTTDSLEALADYLIALKTVIQPPVDFWSTSVLQVQLQAAATSLAAMATVTVASLPTGATVVKAVAMMMFGDRYNAHATTVNKLNGATVADTSQVIQVADDTPGTYYDAINFADDQLNTPSLSYGAGVVIIGSINLAGAGKVDANDGYIFRWLLSRADLDFLNLNDVQFGLRIWYTV